MIVKKQSLSAQCDLAIKRLDIVKKTAVPAAKARAINTIGAATERQTIREVAKSERIKQSALKPRVSPIRKAKTRTPTRKVRLRLTDVPVISIGKPRQTKTGVTVRGRRFSGSFIADGSKGYGKYRKGNRYQSTSLAKRQVLRRASKGRYPLEVVKIPIQKSLTQGYERNVRRAYNQNLPRELAKQLTKELVKINRKQ
jgi:hypothetical protein